MASSAISFDNSESYAADIDKGGYWLRNRRWDLLFITLSVVVVPLPYALYLLGVQLGLEENFSRNLVNTFVAVAIGGPHMMSTFLRTGMDEAIQGALPDIDPLLYHHTRDCYRARFPQPQLDAHVFLLLGILACLASSHIYRGIIQPQGSAFHPKERAQPHRATYRLCRSFDESLPNRYVEDQPRAIRDRPKRSGRSDSRSISTAGESLVFCIGHVDIFQQLCCPSSVKPYMSIATAFSISPNFPL